MPRGGRAVCLCEHCIIVPPKEQERIETLRKSGGIVKTQEWNTDGFGTKFKEIIWNSLVSLQNNETHMIPDLPAFGFSPNLWSFFPVCGKLALQVGTTSDDWVASSRMIIFWDINIFHTVLSKNMNYLCLGLSCYVCWRQQECKKCLVCACVHAHVLHTLRAATVSDSHQ